MNYLSAGENAEVLAVCSAIGVVLFIISLIACPILADRKGRSVGGWLCGALFFGVLALIILACLSNKNDR